ncbi:MAG: peptidoglycan DD-metalloendopeptidase family protein [Deltaproteobacteria bacterium]|nr:peptidoglycan DD-metalloendopeptidase family protein [Deltaproteobacteria bacterium]
MRMRNLLLACALLLGAVQAAASPVAKGPRPAAPEFERLTKELEVVRRVRVQLADKLAARKGDLATRVRALYKLTRGGFLPLWVEEQARLDLVRRRAYARRMILRDLVERKLLVDELLAVEKNERRLLAEADSLAGSKVPLPARGTWTRPVGGRVLRGFGVYRDPATKARLSFRGLILKATPTEPVLAPDSGTVVFVGPVRGLGLAILIDHGGRLLSVLGGLDSPSVEVGHQVTRGARLGTATEKVYVEIRHGARPVDPAPLLQRLY